MGILITKSWLYASTLYFFFYVMTDATYGSVVQSLEDTTQVQ